MLTGGTHVCVHIALRPEPFLAPPARRAHGGSSRRARRRRWWWPSGRAARPATLAHPVRKPGVVHHTQRDVESRRRSRRTGSDFSREAARTGRTMNVSSLENRCSRRPNLFLSTTAPPAGRTETLAARRIPCKNGPVGFAKSEQLGRESL